VLRIALLAAFAALALLSLLILVVVAEIAQGGDLRASDILRSLIVFAPTAALGWLVWREFRPLTAKRLHAQLGRYRKTRGRRRIPSLGDFYRREAADFIVKKSPRAARRFRVDFDEALALLTEEADAADRRGTRNDARAWRVALGVLLADFDAERAAASLRRAHEIDTKQSLTLFLLQRLLVSMFDFEAAERAGRLGRELTDRDANQIAFLDNELWIGVWRADDRRVATVALEVARIAEKTDAEGLGAVANIIVDVEGMADVVDDRLDFPQVRMLLLAIVDIRRALAARAATPEANAELAAALIRAGETLVARANTNEGRALIAEGRALEAGLAR
jgi:hypothetical protein